MLKKLKLLSLLFFYILFFGCKVNYNRGDDSKSKKLKTKKQISNDDKKRKNILKAVKKDDKKNKIIENKKTSNKKNIDDKNENNKLNTKLYPPYIPLFKISKHGFKDSYIYLTRHIINAKYYPRVPKIVEKTINKCDKIYFECSPFLQVGKIDYQTIEALKTLKSKNIDYNNFYKKLLKKIFEIKNDLIKSSSKLYKEYSKKYFSPGPEHLFNAALNNVFDNKNNKFKSIENEILKVILKKGYRDISSLDKYIYVIDNDFKYLSTKRHKGIKGFFKKGFDYVKDFFNFDLYLKSSLKKWAKENALDLFNNKFYEKYLEYKKNDFKYKYNYIWDKFDKNYYKGMHAKKEDKEYNEDEDFKQRNKDWVNKYIKHNQNTFYAVGAAHLCQGNEASLKNLLEKKGFKITHVYGEKIYKEFKGKISKIDDYEKIIDLADNYSLKIMYNPYYSSKMTRSIAEKLESILKNNKTFGSMVIDKLKYWIKFHYEYASYKFKEASEVDFAIGYDKNYCIEQKKVIDQKLKEFK